MEVQIQEGTESPSMSQAQPQVANESEEHQTALDFINSQVQLEADAREALPYAFDSCSQPLGPLRQTLFSCTTCNPPPASPAQVYTPAGICYSCSISCHGDHTLVELFDRRNFVCDCGSTRMPSTSLCTLRSDPVTGSKGVRSQEPAKANRYNHNFQNRFCGCGEEYDAEQEKGTMFQCVGLGSVESGGCGEDWWHAECLMGVPRDWHRDNHKANLSRKDEIAGTIPEEPDIEADQCTPPGFPDEDDFEALLCYKCVESNPWIKQYAGAPGFLPPVQKRDESTASGHSQFKPASEEPDANDAPGSPQSKKRKASEETESRAPSPSKRIKESPSQATQETEDGKGGSASEQVKQKHDLLPPTTTPQGTFSLFLKEDFRDHLCHCPKCYPNLVPHPQLVEEEDSYQPPISESEEGRGSAAARSDASQAGSAATAAGGPRSHETGSLLERGEAALNTIDRVRAIEGVMAYNHLRDKVKDFLKPYAESGEVVGAEDIKAYFEKLRGDEAAIREAGAKPPTTTTARTGGGGGERGE